MRVWLKLWFHYSQKYFVVIRLKRKETMKFFNLDDSIYVKSNWNRSFQRECDICSWISLFLNSYFTQFWSKGGWERKLMFVNLFCSLCRSTEIVRAAKSFIFVQFIFRFIKIKKKLNRIFRLVTGLLSFNMIFDCRIKVLFQFYVLFLYEKL